MTTVSMPTACGLGRADVQRLAEALARQLDFEPGRDIVPVVEQLGGALRFLNFWPLVEHGVDSISMEIRGEGDFTMFLPNWSGIQRRRFEIAHEIGHYILHYRWPRRQGQAIERMAVPRYGKDDRVEFEANWFATAFTMPEASFRKAHKALAGDLIGLSDRFELPMATVGLRAKGLQLSR